jgi:DNA repair protein RadC
MPQSSFARQRGGRHFPAHPSGDPAPSREDRDCTNRLVEASKILGIRVLDHIIFGQTDYYSFADVGLLIS